MGFHSPTVADDELDDAIPHRVHHRSMADTSRQHYSRSQRAFSLPGNGYPLASYCHTAAPSPSSPIGRSDDPAYEITPVLMTEMRMSRMQSIKHLFMTLFIHPLRDMAEVDFLRAISISFAFHRTFPPQENCIPQERRRNPSSQLNAEQIKLRAWTTTRK
jgi:hypothetical protein